MKRHVFSPAPGKIHGRTVHPFSITDGVLCISYLWSHQCVDWADSWKTHGQSTRFPLLSFSLLIGSVWQKRWTLSLMSDSWEKATQLQTRWASMSGADLFMIWISRHHLSLLLSLSSWRHCLIAICSSVSWKTKKQPRFTVIIEEESFLINNGRDARIFVEFLNQQQSFFHKTNPPKITITFCLFDK